MIHRPPRASRRRRLSLLLALPVAALLAGCGSEGGTSPELTTLVLNIFSPDLTSGTATQATVEGRDQNGSTITLQSVQWSSNDPAVVRVTPGATGSATLEGLRAGTVSVNATATVNGSSRTASATVTVTPGAVTVITLAPQTPSIEVGETVELSASLADAQGNAVTSATVEWSTSAPSVASLAGTGGRAATILGNAPGTAVITARVGTATASTQVTVRAGQPADLTVSPAPVALTAGGSTTLTATVRDGAGNVLTNGTVGWSSSAPSVASVQASGGRQAIVTGGSVGTAAVTATIGNLSFEVSVSVTPGAVSTITLAPTSLTLQAGGVGNLEATLRDGQGNTVTGVPVSWTSSNSAVATVAGNGTSATVTAQSGGSTTVTATAGGVQASAQVTVLAATPASVTVSPGTLTLGVGDDGTLAATVRDAQGNALTGPTVSWSTSNGSVATVTSPSNGQATVSAVAPGTATITASAGGVQGTAQVTVQAGAPASVTLNRTSASFSALGSTSQFTATVRDGAGNVLSGASVTWSTDATSVASVSSAGEVTAQGNGSTTLRATSGGATATASITVSQVAVALSFQQVPSTGEATAPFSPALRVARLDSRANPVTNSSATVALSIPLVHNPTGGALTGTASVSTTDGVAVFADVGISKPGNGFRIRASTGGLPTITSSPIDIGPNTAAFYLAITNFNLAGQGAHAVVAEGSDVSLGVSYTLWNSTGCPGCVDQVILGYGEAGVVCAYNAIPGTHPGFSGGASGVFPRPSAYGLPVTGTYQLRAQQTLTFSCNEGYGAYNNNPPSTERAVGTLSVTDASLSTAIVPSVSLNGGGRTAVVAPGGSVSAQMGYQIWTGPGCPSCIQQIVIGVGGDAQACLYDAVPGTSPGVSSTGTVQLTAPGAPGVYEVKYTNDFEFGCGSALADYEANPPPAYRTLGTIIVVGN